MGRVKGAMNKSAEIRAYFVEHPDGRSSECIKSLKDRGIEVSAGLVAVVRSKGPQAGNKRRDKGVTLEEVKIVKAFVARSNLDIEVATKILEEFSLLVRSLGGVDRFLEILNEYRRFESPEGRKLVDMTPGFRAEYEDISEDEDS